MIVVSVTALMAAGRIVDEGATLAGGPSPLAGVSAGCFTRCMSGRLLAIGLCVTTVATTAVAATTESVKLGSTSLSTTSTATLTVDTSTTGSVEGTGGDWPVSTPEEHGVDSGLLADALLAVQDVIPNIHSVTIARNGSLFLDAYFAPYDGVSPHYVASVAKSITTTLIGIAIDQGVIALDDPVLSFSPTARSPTATT